MYDYNEVYDVANALYAGGWTSSDAQAIFADYYEEATALDDVDYMMGFCEHVADAIGELEKEV